MAAVLLLIVLLIIVVLLVRSFQEARSRAGGESTSAERPEPRPTRAQRPRRQPKPRREAKPKVDEEALAEHVRKLREAVDADLISVEEAVASVLRFTDGAISEEAARKMLRSDEAA